MAIVSGSYRVISLDSLIGSLRGGTVPDHAIAVTFDDGYADNLHTAKPLLERYGVKATALVTAGQVDSDREFWWDELERILLLPGRLPERVRLECRGRRIESRLGRSALYTEGEWRTHTRWTVSDRSDPTPRHTLYRKLHRKLRLLRPAERESILSALRDRVGAGEVGRQTHLALTREELRSLVKGDVIAVGAHTMTHPLLARMPLELQNREIRASRQSIEEVTGRSPTSFAYPYGGRLTFSEVTTRAVREAGFEGACSTIAAPVFRGTDPFRIPRFTVGNWDAAVFRASLEAFFRGG